MGRREVCIEFWRGNLGEGYHLKNLGVNGRIILKRYSGSGMGAMDWIDLTQDRDRWRALVNAVMNLRVS